MDKFLAEGKRYSLISALGCVVSIAVCFAFFHSSPQPSVLLDKYAGEIKSLEAQKLKLERALASRRITHKKLSKSSLALDSSTFASSIDEYVTHLKHQLEAPTEKSKQADANEEADSQLADSQLDNKIHTLAQEKRQLEEDLSAIVRHSSSATAFSSSSSQGRENRQQMIAEKDALERQIAKYAKDEDPVVRGVIANYQTDQGGLLANVQESSENVMGSLGVTMTPKQKERQLLMEAEAMGDVSPKEAFSQRVIAVGKTFLRQERRALEKPVVRGQQATRRMIRRHGSAVHSGGIKGLDMVEKLKLELKQAERVAALERKLQDAQRVVKRLEA